MGQTRTIAALMALLRSGLWGKEISIGEYFPLSADEWQEVFSMARAQTISALVLEGVNHLPAHLLPPDELLFKWAAVADSIERRNEAMNATTANLCQLIANAGIEPVVLKGQGIAQLYSKPLQRECGDIDLYFPMIGDFERANSYIASLGIGLTRGGDGSYSYEWQGAKVEHHRHFLVLANGRGRKCLLPLERGARFDKVNLSGYDVSVPMPLENLLLLNTHILSHAIVWGVGLRQFCDLAIAFFKFGGRYDRRLLEQVCRNSGISRWTSLLHSFLTDFIGMPAESLPFPSERVNPELLFRQVIKGGNFGMSRPRRSSADGSWMRRKSATALALLTNPIAWRYARKETFSKLTHEALGLTPLTP